MKTSNSVRLAAWCAVFGIAQACGGDDEAPPDGTSAASVGGGTSTGGTGAVGGTGGTGATGGTVTGGTGGTMVDPPAGGEAGEGGASEGGAAGALDEVGGAGGEGGAPDSGECDPEDIPVGAVDCCGCLCGDATWSCSDDTCIDAEGRAVELAPEAGFFEIAGGPYVSEGVDREAPFHRVWYAFRPADEDPESKPLAVFYNGGPGSATTILFSFNTNFYTLDPEVTGGEPFVENPNSWTRFANLLYIDQPATGFSYPINPEGPTTDLEPLGTDIDHDAGAFIHVVVRFLDRHPAIRHNPVMLVGESYGGTRATAMLEHLLNYQNLVSESAAYQNPALHTELVEHFRTLFPCEDPEALAPAQVARQFGHQVLIQPVVAGSAQWNIRSEDPSVCVTNYDSYQCNEPQPWLDDAISVAAEHLVTMPVLEEVLGVDPTTIQWLRASERVNAYGRTAGAIVPAPELVDEFGSLNAGDNYYMTQNTAQLAAYPGARTWLDPNIGGSFLGSLRYVNTFITNARWDMVVWSPDIPTALGMYTGITSSTHDTEPRTGVDRPGWIEVVYETGGPLTREIRFPFYTDAGHAVSMREPGPFLDDVVDWYSNAPEVAASVMGSVARSELHLTKPSREAPPRPAPLGILGPGP